MSNNAGAPHDRPELRYFWPPAGEKAGTVRLAETQSRCLAFRRQRIAIRGQPQGRVTGRQSVRTSAGNSAFPVMLRSSSLRYASLDCAGRRGKGSMQTVDQIEDDISDGALEAAGMETAGAWTFICTSGIQCRQVLEDDGHLLCGAR